MIELNDPRLTAFVLGELDEQETQTIQAALKQSPELRAAVKEILATTKLLVEQFATEPAGSLTEQQRTEIFAADSESSEPLVERNRNSGENGPGSKHSLRPWFIAAMAAGIAFILGSLIYNSMDWTNDPVADRLGNKIAKITQDPAIPNLSRSEDEKASDAAQDKERPTVVGGVVAGIDNEDLDRKEDLDASGENEPTVRGNRGFVDGNGHGTSRVKSRIALQPSYELHDELEILESVKDFYIAPDVAGRVIDGLAGRGIGDQGGRGGGGGGRGGGGSQGNSEEGWGPAKGKVDGERPVPEPGVDRDMPFRAGVVEGKDHPAPPSRTVNRTSDSLITEVLKKVDPSGIKDITLREIQSDRIKLLVDGKYDQEIELGIVLKSLRADEGVDSDSTTKSLDFSLLEKEISEKLTKRNAGIAASKKSWKRVKATANTSRLMIGDKDELDMQGLQVNVQVDGFRARVLLDCFYYNDRAQQLEGNFKLRLPDDASLYYFAFGQSAHDFSPQGQLSEKEFIQPQRGEHFVSLQPANIASDRGPVWESVKEARMVPKEKAAFAYTQTVRRKVDPALVEWSGAGVFSARVFPLMPNKLHRIVIGYDVSLTKTDDGLSYRLDLPEEFGQCKVNLNVSATAGSELSITPAIKPTGDANQYLYSYGNSKLGEARSIELNVKTSSPVLLCNDNHDEGRFWTTQFTPDLPKENAAANSRGVFLLDTSLSSNPDKFNVWLKLLRETLTQNRDTMKQFSVMLFNVESYFWRDQYVENTPENVNQLLADCEKLALEGATDLYAATDLLISTPWISEGGSPDLFLLSDGAATWGETNLRLIRNQLASANLGNLFAYQTGLTGTAINSLRFLADRSGGAVFSVASEAELAKAATAHRSRPWRVKSIELDGGTDIMTAGRVSWVYPGQTVTLVGRGEVNGNLKMVLSQGTVEKTVTTEFSETLESPLASRMYGYVSVGQLESLGSHIEDVAAAYARHFRITGNTCSLLMLETEADYQRFNIVPQEDLFVIKTRNASELIQKILDEKKTELVSPKTRLLNWIHKLENIQGITFKLPTALKLAIDKIDVDAISKPIVCKNRNQADVSDEFLKLLVDKKLDYNAVVSESKKRGLGSAPDAIKVLSSLIEQNPGDLTLARDIAFVAMELDEPAQAYNLLRQVALARPFEPTIYPAIGKCLTQLGKADMAILFYEIAIEAQFQNRTADYRQIVAVEYMHLLRKIQSDKLDSKLKEYAAHRLMSLNKKTDIGEKDIVITMMWNTDSSDVDLHVLEPNGEDCHYGHRQTKSGGQITRDITDGFGPEMYTLKEAPQGKYQVKVSYFGSNTNRTNMRSKVYLTIYRNYGRTDETVSYKSVELRNRGDLQDVSTIGVK